MKINQHQVYKNLVMICDTIFVCLPTPMKNRWKCDLCILEESAFEINTLTEFESLKLFNQINSSTRYN
jgi:UDP-N-acetyl-D-mannosaminuronate dehydrogenase